MNTMHKSLLLLVLGALTAEAGAPRSAVITLGLPVGARQLGMGETGVALAEDVFTSYWNPAGLAFKPLAEEWELSLPTPKEGQIQALTAKVKSGFLSQGEAWASSGPVLYHWRAGSWRNEHLLNLEGDLTPRAAIRRYMGSDANLDEIVAKVKAFNGLSNNTPDDEISSLRMPFNLVLKDTITALLYDEKGDKLWVGTSKGLFRYDGAGWKSFAKDDLGERRILALKNQGSTLWVGTDDGLWRLSQGTWTRKGTLFGKTQTPVPQVTPADTTLRDSSTIARPADSTKRDSSTVANPTDTINPNISTPAPVAETPTSTGSQVFNCLDWNDVRGELYVCVKGVGIARLKPSTKEGGKDTWNLYNMSDSLIDLNPNGIAADTRGQVWVSHSAGVSHFNQSKWEKILFEKNEVRSVNAASDGSMWFGTRNGLWKFIPSAKDSTRIETADTSQSKESIGEWEHYHQGTGMINHNVLSVISPENDIWVATTAGVEHLSRTKRQVGLFYENLLPRLSIPDLYHFSTAISWPLQDWGTLGGFVNFVSFGEAVSQENENAPEIRYNSKEMVAALSYGMRIAPGHALGVNAKFIYSDLLSGIPGKKDAKTMSWAFDLSYLARNILPGVHIGGGLFNMGPEIYYTEKSQVDPIPLTWRAGIAWEVLRLPEHRIVLAGDYHRETLSEAEAGDPDPFYISAFKGWRYGGVERAMFNCGAEYTWDNMIAFRTGYLYDRPGQREELDAGISGMVSDILQADFGVIVYDFTSNDVRQGQTRLGLTMKF